VIAYFSFSLVFPKNDMQNNQDTMWSMMYPSYRSNSSSSNNNNMGKTTSMMTIQPEDVCLDPTPMGPRSMIQVVDSIPLEHVSTLLAATSSTRTPTQLFQSHEEVEYLLRPLLEMDSGHHKNNIHDFDVDDIDVDESARKHPRAVVPMEDDGDDADDDDDVDDDADDDLEAFYQKINGLVVVPPTLIPAMSSVRSMVGTSGEYWSSKRPAIDCAVTGLVVRPNQVPTMSSAATAMVGNDWSFRSPIVDCVVCHVKKDGLVTRRVSCDEPFCPASITTKSKSMERPPPHKKHAKTLKPAPPAAAAFKKRPPTSSSSSDAAFCKLRSYQAMLWKEKFQELCDFKGLYGTCHVPHDWSINPSLAKWVKRQRYQYKLKKEGKHTTLTDTREAALDELGFVWQSHLSAWEDKYQELLAYQAKHGHCHVPGSQSLATSSEHPQLAVWVQCQRRQYRLYCRGERSFMTEERVQKLDSVGFVWRPRQAGGMTTAKSLQNKKKQQQQQQQEQQEFPNPIMSSFTSV
jgi:hypothetical protein